MQNMSPELDGNRFVLYIWWGYGTRC